MKWQNVLRDALKAALAVILASLLGVQLTALALVAVGAAPQAALAQVVTPLTSPSSNLPLTLNPELGLTLKLAN